MGVSKFVDFPKKFAFRALVSKFEKKNPLALVIGLWRIRVEKATTLCGLLNRE